MSGNGPKKKPSSGKKIALTKPEKAKGDKKNA